MTVEKTRSYRLSFVAILSASVGMIFYRLGDLLWTLCDESYTAYCVNQVIKKRDWLINFEAGGFKYGGAKPPLFIWMEVGMAKAFGFNEWSLRVLPALAGVLTIMILFYFIYRVTGQIGPSAVCALVLLTTQGYINHHVTRSGDFDSLLTLFTTLYLIFFYSYLLSGKNRFLWIFSFFLSLAFLTKSTEALLFLPCLGAFALFYSRQRPGVQIINLKKIMLSICIFLAIVSPYYIIKEMRFPGYIHYCIQSEMVGKFVEDSSPYSSYWTSAYKLIFTGRYLPWIFLYPIAAYYLSRRRKTVHHQLLQYCFFLSLTYFVILSFSRTQFSWYLAPFYPVAAITVGLSLWELFSRYKYFIPAFLMMVLLLGGMIFYKFYYRNAHHYLLADGLFGKAIKSPADYHLKYYSENQNWVGEFYINRAAYARKTFQKVKLSDLRKNDLLLFDEGFSQRIDSAFGSTQLPIACWEGVCMVRIVK